MARIVAQKETRGGSAANSIVVSLPAHNNGDLLLIFVGNDFFNNNYGAAPTGWATVENQTGAEPAACYSIHATSSSTTNPTVTSSSTSREHVATTFTIRDVPSSSAIDTSAKTAVSEFRGDTLSVTPTAGNTLILEYVLGADDAKSLYFESSINQVAGVVETDYTYIIGWHHHEPATTATTTHKFANDFSSTSLSKITVSIKDDGNANYVGQVSPYTTPCELMSPFQGGTLGYYDDGTKAVDPTSLVGTIKGTATTYKTTAEYNTISPFFPLIGTRGFNITSGTDTGKYLIDQRGLLNTFDLSSNKISFSTRAAITGVPFDTGARYIGFGSGDSANVATAAKLFQFEGVDTNVKTSDITGVQTYVIDIGQTGDEEYSTLTTTAITKLFVAGFLDSTLQDFGVGFVYQQKPLIAITGSVANPCSYKDISDFAQSNLLNTVKNQSGASSSQFFAAQDIQIGDNSHSTYWDSSFQAVEYPSAYSASNLDVAYNVPEAGFSLTINVKAGDTVKMISATCNMSNFHNFVIDAATSNTNIYDFTGLNILNATVTLQDKSLIDYAGITFSGCKELTLNGADISGGNTISNCVDTTAVTVTSEAAFDKLANCTFSDNNRAITITGNQTGSWSDPNITVSANTFDIEYTGTTNFSIQSANTLTVDNSSSGVLTVVTPTFDLTVDSSEPASQIHVYTTATQTLLDSEASASQLVYTHSSETVDITVLKDGFIPFRQTGLALSGSVTIDAQLVVSREYDSGHGLTYTTDASWSRTNNELTVPTFGVTGQGVFSLIMEAFKSETALRNTAFNIEMDGTGSLFLTDDAEGATDASIENLIECGCAYLDTASATTASWAGVKSVGTATGFQGEYQQIDGTTTTDARATGIFNELIKVFGDVTHGNFDFTGHLVLKFQPNTYRESRSDVLADFGITSLDPTLYIVAMEPVAIGITAGDPAISITIVDHTGVPLVVGGKSFDFEIQDGGANDGTAMLREVNYNLAQDATYQGRDPFNWPEMILQSGATFETIFGIVEGLAGNHGIYVSRSAADHPDFTRHQSNDGTYYVKPITANASISNIVTGSRLRIFNETTATETENSIIGGTSFSDSYTEGTTYTSGDVVTIYITQTSGVTAQLPFTTTVVSSSSGWTVLASQVSDDVYDGYGLNGSTITKFAADYVNDEVDLTIASNFSGAELYSWWSYNLTTSQGISDFFGGITAQDAANILINNTVVSIYLDNTTTSNVIQTDNIRVYRADEDYPVKNPTSGGGGIDVVWRDRVFIAETGVSGLTASESTELFKNTDILLDTGTTIPGQITGLNDFDPATEAVANVTLVATTTTNTDMRGTDSANTVAPDNASITAIKAKTDDLTFTKANELDSNIQSVDGTTITGSGTELDPWGP